MMSSRRARRNVAMDDNMDVVDLMSSDDDEEMDRKPPAREEKSDEVVCLLSEDSDEEVENVTLIPRVAAKRRHPPSESDDDDEVEVLDMKKKPSGFVRAGLLQNGSAHEAGAENNDGYSVSSRRKRPPLRPANKRMNQQQSQTTAGKAKTTGLSITDVDADEDLARKLQKEEERSSSSSRATLSGKTCHDTDIELARQLQQEDEKNRKARQAREKKDANMAASLHLVEERERDQRKLKEIESMKNSKAGRSVLLIEKIIKVIEQHSSTDDLEPVAKDDAVYLAEKVMDLQETFKTDGKPRHICIGYHFTSSTNLESIRTDGLLTVEDRVATKHSNTRNTAFFGNGIYTATNPLGFTHFGDVGLLLAILKGKEHVLGTHRGPPPSLDPDTDTVVGNKSADAPFYDEIILKKSSQVLPLVKFKTNKITDKRFADMVWSIHQQIQQVLDEYFNESITTTVNRVTAGTRLPAATSSMIKIAPLPMPPAPVHGGFAAGTSFFSMPVAAAGGVPPVPFGGMPSSALPPGAASTWSMAFAGLPSLPAMGFGGMPGSTASVASIAGMSSATPGPRTVRSRRSVRSITAPGLPAMGFGGTPMLSSSAPAGVASVAPGATSAISAARSHRSARITTHVRRSGSSSINETIRYTAPETMVVSTNAAALVPVSGRSVGTDDCSICLCPLAGSTQVVQAKCKHMFHEMCIKASLKHDVKCPDCRQSMTNSGAVQGRGPSGVMTVTTSRSDVSGFTNVGSIMISYLLHGGVQKTYHTNPGLAYGGDARVGYLPNDRQGQDLLKRLKYAFRHGLTFSVGTSLTTHQPNVIVWGSIHHKTSMHGGPHGFPDPNYFANANSELDGAGVPPASQL